MKSIWVIKVTYYQSGKALVNFNEGYINYVSAKSAILKKINPEYLQIEDNYRFYDKDNEIEYELKLVDIYE